MNILGSIANLILPNRCVFCGVKCPDNKYKCENCILPENAHIRVFNIGPGVRGKKPHLLRVHSPCIYAGYYRKSLHLYKFRGKTTFAKSYAGLISDMNIIDKSADFITFVPMTKNKVRERGYNQSELLALRISEKCGIPVKAVLEKTQENSLQHTLNMEERKKNVKNVFSLNTDVKDQNIILVDDIVTTGATLCECASILYKAGAKNVYGICAADAQTKDKSEKFI